MFKMTVEEALERQEAQLAYYERLHPGITEKIKAQTTAHELEPGKLYDVFIINRHVPRGGAIESALGIVNDYRD